jgi:hypothetical protein
MSYVVQEPPGQLRVCDWALLSPPAASPMQWPDTLSTRSKSSDLHFGHRNSIASSFFITRNSKQSLHFKHLNSYNGIILFL